MKKIKKEKSLTCRCDCCHTDIPLSSALSAEGRDYVFHFCGPDCFEKWKTLNSKKKEND